MIVFEQAGDREMNAIGRRAVRNEIAISVEREHPQGNIERQRITRTTAIAIGSDDGNFGQGCERIRQSAARVLALKGELFR